MQYLIGIEKGDIEAKNILKNYINDLINGLKEIEKYYNIKDIVIGGGITEHTKYFIEDIRDKLLELNIHIAKYKNDSGIIGAALLGYI